MSAGRLFAIGVIFVLATIAWFMLGISVQERTGSTTDRLADEVSGLWGAPQVQGAPVFAARSADSGEGLEVVGSDVSVALELDQRRKGLLWYATYVADFAATYRVSNPAAASAPAAMTFTFPDPAGLYDGFAVTVDGREVPVEYRNGQAIARFEIPAEGRVEVRTGYVTNGLERWSYDPNPTGAGIIRELSVVMTTDFPDVDYPDDGVSPTSRERVGDGWRLAWDYDSVVSGQAIGVVMPAPLNPGPLVARITYFAPVSLLFFFAALVLLTATNGVRLHPVHYGFLAAAFFAFHLLLAYLADQIDVSLAFAVASVTSIVLVISYLRAVVGASRALLEIAVSQILFLVLFSYSFFFEGITGLAVTIGAVLTLAFFMFKTVHVDWDEVFVKRERADAGVLTPAASPSVPRPAKGP